MNSKRKSDSDDNCYSESAYETVLSRESDEKLATIMIQGLEYDN